MSKPIPSQPADPVPEPARRAIAARWSQRFRALRAAVTHWISEHRLATASIGSVGSLIVVTAIVVYFNNDAPQRPRRVLSPDDALAALDRHDHDRALTYANQLRQATIPDEQRYVPPYVLGMLEALRADTYQGRQRLRHFALAARWLEEARDRGWQPPRSAAGRLMLIRALLESGRVTAAREMLIEASRDDAADRVELSRLGMQAWSRDPDPDAAQALSYCEAYLASGSLSPEVRQTTTLEQARLLLGLSRYADCYAALDRLPADAPTYAEALLLKGEAALQEAQTLLTDGTAAAKARAVERLHEAIATLADAQQRNRSYRPTLARSSLLTARCQAALGEAPAAIKTLEQLTDRFYSMPETWAAEIDLAGLLLDQKRTVDALTCYRNALRTITNPEQFSNPWITRDQLRGKILAAYEACVSRQQFAAAVALAEAAAPVLAAAQSTQLVAQAYRDWARASLAESERLPHWEAELQEMQAFHQFREAAVAYERLALLRITSRSYPDDLWNAGENFLAAQDYIFAAAIWEKYLALGSRERRLQALANLGESQLALGQVERAEATLDECLERSGDEATVYRARWLAAQVRLEKNQPAEAEALLRENLEGPLLTPASKEWRESLWSLCRVMYQQGRFDQAIPRLDEAVNRYPKARATVEMRYLLAESFRRAAEQADEQAAVDPIPQERAALEKQAQEHFTAALPQYQRARDDLVHRREARGLSAEDRATLRNCCFGRGLVLYRLERYEEAIEAYLAAIHDYQAEPVSLDAYVQVAACYRRLGQAAAARSALLQAKAMLAQFGSNDPFTQTTNFSRQQWTELLDELDTL